MQYSLLMVVIAGVVAAGEVKSWYNNGQQTKNSWQKGLQARNTLIHHYREKIVMYPIHVCTAARKPKMA